ncbi:unknown protein [Simkania negevensis Z]|uniref:Uncharacterized protein n=1 Tax=Simkania negevensis (strain ATCC VR-1471 / DSM 27360 / Z) TaxID=331113 RepID=F8L7T7_SIMNZ|nr:unknown protein [Simkania negevensis Z]
MAYLSAFVFAIVIARKEELSFLKTRRFLIPFQPLPIGDG